MKSIVAVFVMILTGLGTYVSNAALVTFDFAGTSPGLNSPWNTGTVIDPNASTTGFSLGGGINGASANNRFNANSWSTGTTVAGALADEAYFGFVLTVGSGYIANLDGASVDFSLQTSWTGAVGNGPKNYALFSSIDGFASGSELMNDTVAGTSPILTYTFNATSFDNLTGDIEFRVYGWNAVTGAGTMSANTFAVDGEILLAPVPEPAEWGLIAAVGLLGICGQHAWRMRRRTASQS